MFEENWEKGLKKKNSTLKGADMENSIHNIFALFCRKNKINCTETGALIYGFMNFDFVGEVMKVILQCCPLLVCKLYCIQEFSIRQQLL